jgi:hypothetical protein
MTVFLFRALLRAPEDSSDDRFSVQGAVEVIRALI